MDACSRKMRPAIDGRGVTCWLLHRGSFNAGELKRRAKNRAKVTRAHHGVWPHLRLRTSHPCASRSHRRITPQPAAVPGELDHPNSASGMARSGRMCECRVSKGSSVWVASP
jgi:hypothetical protein